METLSLSLNRFKPLKLLVPELLDLSILFSFDILFFSEHPLLVNQWSLLRLLYQVHSYYAWGQNYYPNNI